MFIVASGKKGFRIPHNASQKDGTKLSSHEIITYNTFIVFQLPLFTLAVTKKLRKLLFI